MQPIYCRQYVCTRFFGSALAAVVAFTCTLFPSQIARCDDVEILTSWTTGLNGPNRNVSGSNRILIFTAGMESGSNRTITSVTFGGRSLTQINTDVAGSSTLARAYMFYLDEAGLQAATSNTFSVNWSGSVSDARYAARIYGNVDQSNPIRDSDTASTNSSSPNPIVSSALTVEDGDYVVAAAQCGNPQSYSWNYGFYEGTDQQASSSTHSTANRSISSNGTAYASATNNGPNRQVLLAAVLQHYEVLTPNIYYVRTDGSNSNSGTGPSASAAWRTLESVVEKSLEPGDIIYVRAGTYTGEIRPTIDGTSSKPIRFIADRFGSISDWPAGDVILRASNDDEAIDIEYDDYLEFDGFKIQGDNTSDKEAVKLKDCTGVVLSNCEIFEGGDEGITLNDASAKILNCLIHDNDQEGIYIQDNSNVTITNCTIAHNGREGIEQDNGTTYITNCILIYNTEGLDRDGGTMYHDYNLSWNNSSDNYNGTSRQSHELEINPQLVNPGNRNYQLTSSSPCINSGTSAAGSVDTDIDAIPRPLGSTWDMGCYEYPLIGNWKFDEGSGTTAADSSGNDNDGTLQGSVGWESVRCAHAIELGGTNDWVDIGQVDIGTKAYSLGAWFKTTGSARQTIFAATASGTNNHLMYVELDSTGKVNFVHRYPAASSGGTTLSSTDTFRDGKWHYVTAVKSETELLLYVDGELVDQTSDTTAVHSSVELAIGRSGAALSQYYFDGSIDDLIFYAKALSTSDILSLYNLVGYWKLDETSGTTAKDSSLGGNDGTTTSSPDWTTGKVDGGLQFNGTSDKVVIPDQSYFSAHTTTGLTVMAWVKVLGFATDSSGQGRQPIVAKGYSSNWEWALYVYDSGKAGFSSWQSTGSSHSEIWGGTISIGTWAHVAATFEDNVANRVYINGVQVAVGTSFAGDAHDGNRDVHIGAREDGQYLNAIIDDVKIYNRALCADEILEIQSSSSPAAPRITKWVEIK